MNLAAYFVALDLINKIRDKHNLVFKLSMVVFFSAIIAWFLPKHQVNANRVNAFSALWNDNDLVVEQDFFIRKNKDELEKEKEFVKRQSILVFEENVREIKRMDSLAAGLKKKLGAYNWVLSEAMDSIRKVGIIEQMRDSIPSAIYVFKNGYYEKQFYESSFTIQSAINYLEDKLKPFPESDKSSWIDDIGVTLLYSTNRTKLLAEESISHLSIYKYYYPKGSILVKQGEPLSNEKRFLINNYIYQIQKASGNSFLQFVSKWAFVGLLLMMLGLYLYFFRKPFFGNNKQFIFLFFSITVLVINCHFVSTYNLYLNAIPYVLLPLIIRVFYDSRTALFTYLTAILPASFYQTDKLQFILIQLIAGIITLFSVAEIRRRTQLINTFLISLLLYLIAFFLYQLAFEKPEIAFKLWSYLPFIISSVLLLLSFPLIYLIEKLFKFDSDFTLLELSDLNHPLLRELSDKIPGTFQHSLQVANLAEEAIYYIGGNTLLVRTGALFHDIGKLKHPRYFIENQGPNRNPHEDISPEESARIIIGHIITGIEIAKQHKLPESVIDFIRTHHGTTSVGYFLSLYKKAHGENKTDEQKFKYPGPIPFSKETAVLMLADGVEAASRSLKEHDALSINDLVDKIIDYKIQQNQLINSDITFKDITLIRKIFKRRLMNIYHVRIEYPR
jgi:cyclic-di-AMP phosphodiesterase PgpH